MESCRHGMEGRAGDASRKESRGQIKKGLCVSLKSWILKLIRKDTRTPMFIAALFTMAKIRKQP